MKFRNILENIINDINVVNGLNLEYDFLFKIEYTSRHSPEPTNLETPIQFKIDYTILKKNFFYIREFLVGLNGNRNAEIRDIDDVNIVTEVMVKMVLNVKNPFFK